MNTDELLRAAKIKLTDLSPKEQETIAAIKKNIEEASAKPEPDKDAISKLEQQLEDATADAILRYQNDNPGYYHKPKRTEPKFQIDALSPEDAEAVELAKMSLDQARAQQKKALNNHNEHSTDATLKELNASNRLVDAARKEQASLHAALTEKYKKAPTPPPPPEKPRRRRFLLSRKR